MIQELLIALGVDSTRFQIGLKKAESNFGTSLKRMRSSAIKSLGAGLSTAGIQRLASKALTAADEIDNIASQLAITTEEVQRLDIALAEAGLGGAERLNEALESLNRNRVEAYNGNEKLIESFKLLGISMADVGNPNVRSIDILKRISAVPNVTSNIEKRVAATSVIGNEAGKFLSAILASQTDAVGRQLIYTEEELKSLNKVLDGFNRVLREVTIVLGKGIAAWGPAFSKMVDVIAKIPFLPSGYIARIIQGARDRYGEQAPSSGPKDDFRSEMAKRGDKRAEEFFNIASRAPTAIIRQSGIDTRNIGGLAFSRGPDQIITIQTKSLAELQKQTIFLMQLNQTMQQAMRPF